MREWVFIAHVGVKNEHVDFLPTTFGYQWMILKYHQNCSFMIAELVSTCNMGYCTFFKIAIQPLTLNLLTDSKLTSLPLEVSLGDEISCWDEPLGTSRHPPGARHQRRWSMGKSPCAIWRAQRGWKRAKWATAPGMLDGLDDVGCIPWMSLVRLVSNVLPTYGLYLPIPWMGWMGCIPCFTLISVTPSYFMLGIKVIHLSINRRYSKPRPVV